VYGTVEVLVVRAVGDGDGDDGRVARDIFHHPTGRPRILLAVAEYDACDPPRPPARAPTPPSPPSMSMNSGTASPRTAGQEAAPVWPLRSDGSSGARGALVTRGLRPALDSVQPHLFFHPREAGLRHPETAAAVGHHPRLGPVVRGEHVRAVVGAEGPDHQSIR
jgi:hypothetical protein